MISSSSSYTDYSSSYSSSNWLTSRIDVSKDVDEPGGTTDHLNRHHRHHRRIHPIPFHPLCDQDRRNRTDSETLNDPRNQVEGPNAPATKSTSITKNSVIPRSPTTPTPTTITADSTEGTMMTTLIESSPASSMTILPVRTPPPTLTKEDKIIFNNLTVLLFELIITVYREHLCLRHYTRR